MIEAITAGSLLAILVEGKEAAYKMRELAGESRIRYNPETKRPTPDLSLIYLSSIYPF